MMSAHRSSDLHLSTLSGQITGNVLSTRVCSSRAAFGSGFAWVKWKIHMQVFGTVVTRCYCCLHLVTFFMSVKDLLPETEPLCEIPQTWHHLWAELLGTYLAEQPCGSTFVCYQSCMTILRSFTGFRACVWPILSPDQPQNQGMI